MSGLTSPYWISKVACGTPAPDATNQHPFDIPAVRALQAGLDLGTKITFLVGENGSGKSTILEALAVNSGFNPEGGSVHLRFATRASHSGLHQHLEIRRHGKPKNGYFLRAESFYNVISTIEELDAELAPAPLLMRGYTGPRGGTLHHRSHGEAFWDLISNRFGPKGLYFLDEPESALSPERQLAVLRRMHDLTEEGCQFVVATHSPLLLAYPGAKILLLDKRGITPTAYDDLPVVRVYRGILANPQARMQDLLSSDGE